MKNWLIKIFINDWELIKFQQCNWNIDTDFGNYTRKCSFEILYSEIRNKYKIKTRGFKPKQHQYCQYMMGELIKLNKYNLTNIKPN